ncbi:MAG: hypothetical protein Tsb0019_10500 [Roseibium sp.]
MPLSGTICPMTTKLKHESLDRGLAILETLTQEGDCSLADLHRLTGISKSSIRRLLATLIVRRLVRRSLSDGRYRSAVTFPVSAGAPLPASMAWLVDVALPHVIALTRAIEWPSDIHLLSGDRMRVVDSTRPLSPFHLYRGVVNRDINIFGSATGMCCLAELGDAEFRRIAAHTKGDKAWGLARYRLGAADYLAHLRATRQRGYGVRLTPYVGETAFDDGLAAIACPIYAGNRVMGAVSLLWAKSYLTPERFAERYAGDLKDTVRMISATLSDAGSAPVGIV